MCVPRDFPNSLHIQYKYLVAMATDFEALIPLSPPFYLVVPVCPLVPVLEKIRRAVIRHSGASLASYYREPRFVLDP